MKSIRLAPALALFGWPGALAQELPDLPDVSQVPIQMSVRYYEIDGRRYGDAVEAMQLAGPIGFDAETRTWSSSYFEYHQTGQGCALTLLELPLEVEILYPRWLGYDRARRADRQRWDGHMHILTVHENVHALIAFLGTIEAYNDIVRLEPQPECAALESIIRATMDEANERIHQWQRDYDRITEHGREQSGFDLTAFMGERL